MRSKLDVLKGADVELKRRLVELSDLEKRLQLTVSQLEQERCEKVSGRREENKEPDLKNQIIYSLLSVTNISQISFIKFQTLTISKR